MPQGRRIRAFAALAAALLLFFVLLIRQARQAGLLDGFVPPPPRAGAAPGGAAARRPPCEGCHDEADALHRRGPHRTLACPECHAGAGRHVVDGEVAEPMGRVEGVTRLCSRCHRDLPAATGRPNRINLEAHVVEAGGLFRDDVCLDCHRPHDPRP